MKNLKTIKWIAGGLILLLIFAFVIGSILPQSNSLTGGTNFGIVMGALALGMLLMYLTRKAYFSQNNSTKIRESSHTVVESIRKVFKIVTAEGQFNEIYNYEETTKILGIIPTQKKALVIVSAKASFGYNFEKCVWEIDESAKKIKLISFPAPEIISLDTDYQYYNIEENLLNKFSREDLGRIQANGKKQVILAAQSSRLPKVAAEQMTILLTEVLYTKEWTVENIKLIGDALTELPAPSPTPPSNP